MQTIEYGDDPSQYGELSLPAPGVRRRAGIAVLIHGGYWRSRYGAELGQPLAADLAAHGVPSWNLEYRRAGNGGGWPETFEDVAAGIDILRDLERDLDLSRVVFIGHSAGGHLATWAAGREKLPEGVPGAEPRLLPDAVVSQSGLLDLGAARQLGLSDRAVVNFLAGQLDDARYHWADPIQQVPVSAKIWAVYGEADDTVPAQLSKDYVVAARAAGGDAELVAVPGDHFALIDPVTLAWRSCRELVLRELP